MARLDIIPVAGEPPYPFSCRSCGRRILVTAPKDGRVSLNVCAGCAGALLGPVEAARAAA